MRTKTWSMRTATSFLLLEASPSIFSSSLGSGGAGLAMEAVALSPESEEHLRILDHELLSKQMKACFIL